MNKRKLFAVLAICLAVGLMASAFTAACAPAKPGAGEPVKIGVLLPYTGANADMLPWMENGAKLAAAEVGGEVAGRPIKLILEDSATEIAPALDKARKMVEEDKVDVIVLEIMSHVASAVRAYTANTGTPTLYIEHCPIEDLTKFPVKNAFMHCGTLLGRGYPLGLYAYDTMGARTATVIHDDFVAGEDFTQGFMDAFVYRGGKIIQRQRTPIANMDYGPYLTAMKDADICAFWFIPMDSIRFVTQFYEYGKKMPLVEAGCATFSEILMKQMGDKALGMISDHAYMPGIDLPGVKAYVDRWVKQYGNLSEAQGRFPRLNEGNSTYMSVRLAVEAIKTTKGDTSKEAICSALRNLKWESPWGLISFTGDGLGIGESFVIKAVKEGDRYYWKDIYTYKQIVRDIPPEIKGKAPKM